MSPHRKKLKRHHEAGHFHELTFSCYKRMSLLTNHTWRHELAKYIDNACKNNSIDLTAFVFMPNHVHLLVNPKDEHPDIGRFLASFKQPFSKYIKGLLAERNSRLLSRLTVRERPGKHCFRFWQEGGGYDRNLFEASTIEAAIDYIHMNPVKSGLCRKAVDWKWSSARRYILGEDDSELPRVTSPPPELFDQGGVQVPHY